MAVWSVEEQTISTALFTGDHHPHISSISLRMGHPDSSTMEMELRVEPDADADPHVQGYILHFQRNGLFISAEPIPGEIVEPPAATAVEDEDEDEDEPKPTATKPRGRRY